MPISLVLLHKKESEVWRELSIFSPSVVSDSCRASTDKPMKKNDIFVAAKKIKHNEGQLFFFKIQDLKNLL